MIIMAIDVVEQTSHMLAQRVIQNQERVRFRTADRLRLLEQILDATVIDAVLEPRRCEKKRERLVWSALSSTQRVMLARSFVVQDDQTCQVMLENGETGTDSQRDREDVRVAVTMGAGVPMGSCMSLCPFTPGRKRA